MYKLLYTAAARQRIREYNTKTQKQLKKAIERLADEPKLGKRLTQELTGYWSYRMGDHRIIYQIQHKEIQIIIITVGDRKQIYKSFSRKLS
ncbi:MAG: mRNA interferase RelE/StbE [Candidatus Omnitrophota bacterium]|jgi:mRNA interferase RelE/StbE